MKINYSKLIVPAVVSISAILFALYSPSWLPSPIADMVQGFAKGKAAPSFFKWYAYSIFILTGVFGWSVILNKRIKFIKKTINWLAQKIAACGFSSLATILATSVFMYLNHGAKTAFQGLVLAFFAILFFLGPIYLTDQCLKSYEMENVKISPQKAKILNIIMSTTLVIISLWGIIEEIKT